MARPYDHEASVWHQVAAGFPPAAPCTTSSSGSCLTLVGVLLGLAFRALTRRVRRVLVALERMTERR